MKKNGTRKIVLAILVFALTLTGIGIWQGRGETALSPARIPEATLVIDAGHGGEDGGAVSPSGVVESHINLAVSFSSWSRSFSA